MGHKSGKFGGSNDNIDTNKSFVDYGSINSFEKDDSEYQNIDKQPSSKLVRHEIETDASHSGYEHLYMLSGKDHWLDVALQEKSATESKRLGLTRAAYTDIIVSGERDQAALDFASSLHDNTSLGEYAFNLGGGTLLEHYYTERIGAEIDHPRRRDERAIYEFTLEPDVTVDDYVSRGDSAAHGLSHNDYEIVNAMYLDTLAQPKRSYAFVRRGGNDGARSSYDVYETDAEPGSMPLCFDDGTEGAAVCVSSCRKIGSYEPVVQREKIKERDVEVIEKKAYDKDAIKNTVDNKEPAFKMPHVIPEPDKPDKRQPRPQRDYPEIEYAGNECGDSFDDNLSR